MTGARDEGRPARRGESELQAVDTQQIFPNGPLPKPERMTETSDWKRDIFRFKLFLTRLHSE
jgi:hypothetical protein